MSNMCLYRFNCPLSNDCSLVTFANGRGSAVLTHQLQVSEVSQSIRSFLIFIQFTHTFFKVLFQLCIYNIYIYTYTLYIYDICIYIYIYIYPHTRVSSCPGLISVARVNEQRTTDVTRVLKTIYIYIYVNIYKYIYIYNIYI